MSVNASPKATERMFFSRGTLTGAEKGMSRGRPSCPQLFKPQRYLGVKERKRGLQFMGCGEESRMMTTCNHLLDVGKRRNGRRLLDDGFCAKAELVVFIGTPTVSLTNN